MTCNHEDRWISMRMGKLDCQKPGHLLVSLINQFSIVIFSYHLFLIYPFPKGNVDFQILSKNVMRLRNKKIKT